MATTEHRDLTPRPGRPRVPFALRRPGLLVKGGLANRADPDLAGLEAIEDPDAFVWAILPYAARTFATSIIMLPAEQARTAAVAYLYCRMLDTFEDLTDPDDREGALAGFAERMETMAPIPSTPLSPRSESDRTHVLLVRRHALVDQVFASLSVTDRGRIVGLVKAMADGMIWSARRFAEQGGVLMDPEQVRRYCHHVIGEPVLFALLLVSDGDLTAERRSDALAVSELIQLANITRDVERDLERGIGYDPGLLPHLGSTEADEPVREARRRLMLQALPNASAYTRLSQDIATRRFSLARASAVLMLLHTDRYYSRCAQRIGHSGWRVGGGLSIVANAAVAAVSRRWSHRVMRRVEGDFLSAAEAIGIA